jgi:non-ribosomal peptide synthase protein (TIGR01720 family)
LRLVGDAYVSPSTEIESELAQIWTEVLKIEKIGIHDNFFRIGGDSIISIQLVVKARQKSIYFAVKDVFNYPTIRALASIAHREKIHTTADQGIVTGDIPLTPIQQWFFSRNLSEPHHLNQAVLLCSSEQLDLSLLNRAFTALVTHHDALRVRYHYDQQWHQECIVSEDHVLCSQIDLSHIREEDFPIEIEREASRVQASLNLETGPLIKAVLFEGGNEQQRILIVIHHLVVDGVSWRILIEDLEHVYRQLSRDEVFSLPSKTHSYQQWAQALKEYATSQVLEEERPYWQQIEEHTEALPTDFNEGPSIGSATSTIRVSLTEEETANLLQRVPKAYRTEINDILLTALVLALGDWTKKYYLTLSLEGHGREDIIKDIDLSQTIGWFTSLFPVHLRIENPSQIGEAIKGIKETLRQIPHKGIGYGILEYLTPKSRSFSLIHPSLSFNYLGQWDNTIRQDSLLSYAQESAGNSVSEKNERSHLLDINGDIREGRLQVFWSYSTNHYHAKTIEKISHAFLQRLQ